MLVPSTQSICSCESFLLFNHLPKPHDEELAHRFFFALLVINDVSDDFANLLSDVLFRCVCINLLHEVILALLNTKGGQPLAHTRFLLVERDHTVDQGARMIAILVDWL